MKDIPPLSQKAKEFKLGHYEHYKGGRYNAYAVGRDSETLVEMVYYTRFADGSYWNRPLEMFIEEIEIEGKKIPRFRKLPLPGNGVE